MKKVLLTLMAFGAMTASALTASAEEKPAITFKTNIYDSYGAENRFQFVIGATETDFYDVDCGFGMVETEVVEAEFDTETSSVVATTVQCRVSKEGIVKIYGDASKIDYLDCEGCYIDWIEMDDCVNLNILDMSHNELKRLDLTPFTKLSAIYLSDNPFTAETPLVVGPDHPNLTILEIDIVDHLDQNFNLSDYPELVAFDAYHNMDLRKIDPTGCPKLQVMSLELTQVETVDVTRNPNLIRLNLSDTRVREVDLSKNTNLTALFWQHTSGSINTDVKVDAVDVTHNPYLMVLNLNGNNLTSIDLSKNTNLTNLGLRNNRLTSIDLSNNKNLYSVDLTYNYFTFPTLPLPQDTWGEYYYLQNPLPCNRSYEVGKPVDFSEAVLRPNTTTSVQVYTNPLGANEELLSEDAYTYADGVVTFKEVPTDSVYIRYSNSAFTEYTLSTGHFKVKTAEEMNQPSPILSFVPAASLNGTTVKFKVGLDRATAEAPRTFTIGIGDSARRFTCTATSVTADSEISLPLPAGEEAQTVTLYMEEGDVLTALDIDGVALQSIDLTAARELRTLEVTNCSLTDIDMRYNRCLTAIDLSGNALTSLSVAGIFGDYEKYALRSIVAANNRIADFDIVSPISIRHLDLSHNCLAEMSLKDYDYAEYLDISYNKFTDEASLVYFGNARHIDISHNGFTSVSTADMPYIETLDMRSNNLTLATLPYLPEIAADGYLYAPQQPLEIVEKAPAVNISEQNRVIDGTGTTFTWMREDGTPLTTAEVDCKDGATIFLDTTIGKVYCRMDNPAFPAFTGENSFVTTLTTVVDAPTKVVASFTTTTSTDGATVIFRGSKKTALYIDWRGDGTEYKQYPVEATGYIAYAGQQTYEGAKVKIYTYDDASDITVFSIYGAPMKALDASNLTGLKAFSIGGCDIDEDNIRMPAATGLEEINLSANNFSRMNFAEYTSLRMLNISNNAYTSFDASKIPSLQSFFADSNKISELQLGNAALWNLSVNSNPLESLQLTGVPSLSQLTANNCSLSAIDLSPVRTKLQVLTLEGNRFRFSTLPRVADLPSLLYYTYANQADVEVTNADGTVDLSSEASVSGIPTTFTWYMGEITEDEETGELVGEKLNGPDSDDPEYLLSKGVTRFRYTFVDPLRCVLTNLMFPKLTLFTTPVLIDHTGVENVAADLDSDLPVDVYSISGVLLRHKVAPAEALRGLTPGIYIVGGRKVAVK